MFSESKIENEQINKIVDSSLVSIIEIFDKEPPRGFLKNSLNRTVNDSLNLQPITINKEAYSIIEKENGKKAYVFEVDYPSSDITKEEIINLHIYRDANNEFRSQLIKYDLTPSQLQNIVANQDTNFNTSVVAFREVLFHGGWYSCCGWTFTETTSISGGGSGQSIPYSLPPLSSLPPNAIQALINAGVFIGIDYNNLTSIPYSGSINYTTPVQFFSVNDLYIPMFYTSGQISFNNYYSNNFPEIKDLIKDYYENVYVEQLDNYVFSSQTDYADHNRKQQFINNFFYFLNSIQQNNQAQFDLLRNNPLLIADIFNYFKNETSNGQINSNAIQIVDEILNDCINFPIVEGDDNGDDYNFNDYSNIQTTAQNLPGRNLFYSKFPKVGAAGMPANQVYQLIGGSILNSYNNNTNYRNACALRISRALNYTNNPIPVFYDNSGQQKSQKGSDNLNYILDAGSLLAYMKKTFTNNPPIHLVNKTPTQIKKALNGKWGIYIMIPKAGVNFTASGHADFWSDTGCLSGCFFDKAKEVYFWELF